MIAIYLAPLYLLVCAYILFRSAKVALAAVLAAVLVVVLAVVLTAAVSAVFAVVFVVLFAPALAARLILSLPTDIISLPPPLISYILLHFCLIFYTLQQEYYCPGTTLWNYPP